MLVLQVSCQWGLTGPQESWISSVVFIGMCFGAYSFGSLSDLMGRKVGIFATAAFTSMMGLASAVAPNYEVTRGRITKQNVNLQICRRP